MDHRRYKTAYLLKRCGNALAWIGYASLAVSGIRAAWGSHALAFFALGFGLVFWGIGVYLLGQMIERTGLQFSLFWMMYTLTALCIFFAVHRVLGYPEGFVGAAFWIFIFVTAGVHHRRNRIT